jgi:hypothetical protein
VPVERKLVFGKQVLHQGTVKMGKHAPAKTA